MHIRQHGNWRILAEVEKSVGYGSFGLYPAFFPLAMHGKELRRANICRGIYGYSVDMGFQIDDQMHSRQREVFASRPKLVQNSEKLKCILPSSLIE